MSRVLAMLLSGTALAAGWAPFGTALRPRASAPSLIESLEHRLPDDRPPLDVAKLEVNGFTIIESTHLRLVTDLPVEQVRDLPPLADALFTELERQLGPLAPAADGSPFQVTGFLMQARERFDAAGLLPPEQFPVRHGRNVGYRLWLNDQTADYYRRHLLLHEFTHCFLMCEHGMTDVPPLWYTEGIAEFFATHELTSPVARSRFGVLPAQREGFEGWGRIDELKRNFDLNPSSEPKAAGITPLAEIRFPASSSFLEDRQYAQAWALVWLIRSHPELQTHFTSFSRVRTRGDFQRAADGVPPTVWERLNVAWPLFADSVIEGFDTARAFPGILPTPDASSTDLRAAQSLTLSAAAGWQNSGVTLKAGQSLRIRCSGRCSVAQEPKPWVAEPQGITIDYHRGRPLGEVVAMLVSPDGAFASCRIPIGVDGTLTSPADAELWLQINDSAAARSDNDDGFAVELLPASP
jgi:hypothetical protein